MTQSHVNPMPICCPWVLHAQQNISSEYGDTVSVRVKNKDLLKFGHNANVGTTVATIAHQPTGILHETYVSDNLINSVISTSAGDTQEIKIEGHTIDGNGDFTFVSQAVTLTGQTVVALSTPLARVTRLYNNNSVDFAGVISVTETDTYIAGVPQTSAKVHLQVDAGENQSDKASTTISNKDYWIITGFYGDMLKKSAAFSEIILQVRLKGKVFRTQCRISASDGGRGQHEFKPYLVVPPNSDVRLIAIASSASTAVAGGIQGVLAIID